LGLFIFGSLWVYIGSLGNSDYAVLLNYGVIATIGGFVLMLIGLSGFLTFLLGRATEMISGS
jgi:hypothetical protein